MLSHAAVRESQAVQWRERLVLFLIPRLIGSSADKEVAIEMVSAGIREAHDEGVLDAAHILDMMHKATSGEAARVLGIAADAMRELKRRNDEEATA